YFFLGRYSSANGTHQWSKLFGKTGDQGGRGLAAATNGDIFLTGIFSGSVDWKTGVTMTAPAGTTDAYVARLQVSDGSYLMHAKGNCVGACVATSVALDGSENVTVFGHFNGTIGFGGQPLTSGTMNNDTFLVKLRANDWTPAWAKSFGTSGNQYGWDVAVLPNGRTLAGGAFYTELEVPPMAQINSTGGADLFAVRMVP
ncbi:MAG TPA: hypothetical protein PK156_38795, partial [Polyangium sp.]|nr:hypothetical protein [Polyangium sp.]